MIESFYLKDWALKVMLIWEKKLKHRSRVTKDPSQPNLRQVHLIHSELFDELNEKGFNIKDGEIGENITTAGIELLSLPKDTLLSIGDTVIIMINRIKKPLQTT